MPVFVDPNDGFPLWGNPSPQKPAQIPARQISMMLQDLAVNQVPGGRVVDVNGIQKIRPKQSQVQGLPGQTNNEVGQFGSTLYNDFMAGVTKPARKGEP